MNLTKYERRPSREVRIGRVVIGGDRPIAVQSMTNTDTKDTEACIRQIERIFRAGGPIVRLTAQGRRELSGPGKSYKKSFIKYPAAALCTGEAPFFAISESFVEIKAVF